MNGRTRTQFRNLSSLDVGNGQLLAAAAKLFRGAGYAGATTRNLANALGVRSPSLYYHIGKKEDLLYEICVDSLKRITAAVESAVRVERDPLDRVRALIRTHMAVALSDTDKHVTMLSELRSLSTRRRAKVIDLRDAYESVVRRVLSSAQRAGELRSDIRAKYLTLALLNLLNWPIFWYQPRAGLSPDQLASILAEVFLTGARRTSSSARAASGRGARRPSASVGRSHSPMSVGKLSEALESRRPPLRGASRRSPKRGAT